MEVALLDFDSHSDFVLSKTVNLDKFEKNLKILNENSIF